MKNSYETFINLNVEKLYLLILVNEPELNWTNNE